MSKSYEELDTWWWMGVLVYPVFHVSYTLYYILYNNLRVSPSKYTYIGCPIANGMNEQTNKQSTRRSRRFPFSHVLKACTNPAPILTNLYITSRSSRPTHPTNWVRLTRYTPICSGRPLFNNHNAPNSYAFFSSTTIWSSVGIDSLRAYRSTWRIGPLNQRWAQRTHDPSVATSTIPTATGV